MKTTAIVVMISVMAGGCFHRSVVPLNMPVVHSEKINRELANNHVLVQFADGRAGRFRNVSLRHDSLAGFTLLTDSTATLLNRVISFEVRRPGKGALEGAAAGVLPGVITGWMVAGMFQFVFTISTLGLTDYATNWTRVAVISGAVGAGIGAVAGGIRQDRTLYQVHSFVARISPQPPPAESPVACSRGPCRGAL